MTRDHAAEHAEHIIALVGNYVALTYACPKNVAAASKAIAKYLQPLVEQAETNQIELFRPAKTGWEPTVTLPRCPCGKNPGYLATMWADGERFGNVSSCFNCSHILMTVDEIRRWYVPIKEIT